MILIHSSSFSKKHAGGANGAEYQQIVPKIEMRVSAWYVDEFGNKTREVRARD
jgi:hypothetical protein